MHSVVGNPHDLLWYSGSTELAPSGLATPTLTGALEASAASDKLCTASQEKWPRIRLHMEKKNTCNFTRLTEYSYKMMPYVTSYEKRDHIGLLVCSV